jgi:hypothetical protein
MFGLLPYIFESRKNNLIFVFLSALVHFSFLVPISIILLYFIIGNRIKLIFSFFVISIFISEFDLGMMNRYVETYLPEVLIERSSSYRSEATIENREENVGKINRNWYAMFYQELLRWAVISFLFYFFFIARKVIQNKKDLLRLFTLTLLFYIAANILSYLPSGARYYSFANFLGLIFIILYSYYYSNDYKFIRLTYLSSPAILIFIIISVRIGLYSISITTLFGNPLIAILGIGNNISINDLIK